MADGRLEHAVAMLNAGRAAEAAHALHRLVASRPRDPGVALALAHALVRLGEFEQAAHHARRAAAAFPDNPQPWAALGRALLGLGEANEAVEAFERAAAASPDDPSAKAAVVEALQASGRHRSSVALARQALARWPNHAGLGIALAGAQADLGRAGEALITLRDLARAHPENLAVAASRCTAVVYAGGLTAPEAREPFDAFGELLDRLAPGNAPAPGSTPVHANPRDPERRLRIGFLSPDLRAHPVGVFMEAPLAHLDRDAFDIVVYSTAMREDAASARLAALPLTWKRVGALDANSLAREVFTDRIDVLIELSGHSGGHRLAALHARPAPVQATYLGFPSTTGLRAIGWRIADSTTDPPGEAEAWGCERLERVDPCFLCWRPRREGDAPPIEPVRRGEAARPIVFGSCNSVAKLNEEVVAAWARLLRETPGATLLLKHIALAHDEGRADLASRFEGEGVPPDRLDLRGPSDFRGLLDTYNEIDIALDPFPFNGATTTCDALFMGVPVVSCEGRRSAARVGLSILRAIGAPDLCAPDVDSCLAKAMSLASDRAALREYRATLRGRLLASPLCDGPGFASRFGEALRRMWREYGAAHG